MSEPRKGDTFTHNHFTNIEDRHLPIRQARKAVMVITRATAGRVYYTYADGSAKSGTAQYNGDWFMERAKWMETYGIPTEKP